MFSDIRNDDRIFTPLVVGHLLRNGEHGAWAWWPLGSRRGKSKNHDMVTVARHEIDILYIFIMYLAKILMFIHSVAMEN